MGKLMLLAGAAAASAFACAGEGGVRVERGQTPAGDHVVLLPPDYVSDSRPAVIVGHGRGGSAEAFADPDTGYLAWALAEEFPTIASDLAGPTTWGNDASIAATDAVVRYIRGDPIDAADGPVILFGGSMGATVLLNWARERLDEVRAIVLVAPVLDLERVRDENAGGFGREIEAAHGGEQAFERRLPTRSPDRFAHRFVGEPLLLYYSTDDPYCTPAEAKRFASAAGGVATSLGRVGHSSRGLTGSEFREDVAALLGQTSARAG